jgi:hypothetical protein
MKKNKTLNNYCYIFDGYNHNLSDYSNSWDYRMNKVLEEYPVRNIDDKRGFCLRNHVIESRYHNNNKYYSNDYDLFEYWYNKPYSLIQSMDDDDTLISLTDSYGNQTLQSIYYDY